MTKTSRTYKFNPKTLDQINDIQKHYGLPSATAALEYCINKEHKAVIKPYTLERDEDGLFWLSSDGKLVECHYRSEDESEEDMGSAGYVPLFQVFPISTIKIDKSVDPHIDALDELYINKEHK